MLRGSTLYTEGVNNNSESIAGPFIALLLLCCVTFVRLRQTRGVPFSERSRHQEKIVTAEHQTARGGISKYL